MVFEKINKKNMRSMVENFPNMLGVIEPEPKSLNHAEKVRREGIDGICLLGMGGSSIAGEMIRCILVSKSSTPIISVKDYTVPMYVNENWTTIAVSYSGNTEETLSAAEDAMHRGCKTFAITSGGKLPKMVSDDAYITLPKGFQPRAALPLILSVELPLIETLVGINRTDLVEVGKRLALVQKKWVSDENAPLKLAHKLEGKIPLFMASEHLAAVAYRAKCQINENAKTASFASLIPEANHNEIESIGWFSQSNIQPIFLRSITENPRIAARFRATSEIYTDDDCNPIHIWHQASTGFEEMMAHTFLLDMLSVELAKLEGVDDVAVERITKLKNALSN
ncbi:MAG: bifunctional phosphoglucose/phosphomannose isomerase [Candidatus Thorarchaeota archaeon]